MKLYIVRNQEGKYFRSKGFGGYGATWVEDVQKARIYPRIGPARGRVSYFADNWPDFGVPDILELTIDLSKAKILNETERVQKNLKRKAKQAEESKIRYALENKRYLEKQISDAQAKLSML